MPPFLRTLSRNVANIAHSAHGQLRHARSEVWTSDFFQSLHIKTCDNSWACGRLQLDHELVAVGNISNERNGSFFGVAEINEMKRSAGFLWYRIDEGPWIVINSI